MEKQERLKERQKCSTTKGQTHRWKLGSGEGKCRTENGIIKRERDKGREREEGTVKEKYDGRDRYSDGGRTRKEWGKSMRGQRGYR